MTNTVDSVDVPSIPSQLSDQQFRQLTSLINPMSPCDDHGVSLKATREYINQVVQGLLVVY